ncbi:MAG: FtsX-like permease family protein, partial [Lachnospiraceae bacterium]|nr:FtsX-like permease family protein [Lachnospiraceae bacterium]
ADAVRETAGDIDRARYDRISEMLRLTGQEEIPYVEGFVQTRSALFKLVSVNLITDIVSKTGNCLSLMFLLIALLVSYVAITRMVYLQTVQIGMKKSFGFTVFEIVRFYVSYTVLALLIGSVVGGALGILFEYILGGSLTSVYYLDEVLLYFDIAGWILLFLILLAIVIAITVGTVITICRREAVDLLNQTEASAVKHNRYEKLPAWKRLSLLNRTIIKNCTTDKRRVFGTLISVSCCMALFVCAVTFYYNVRYSINTQFGRYFHFDIHIAFDEHEEGALENIRKKLDDRQLRAVPALLKLVSVESKDHKYTQAIVYVVDAEEAADFIDMKGYDTPDDAPFLNGIYAGHAYRSYYGEDSGSMTLYTGDGRKVQITPDGYFLNHMLSEMIFLSADRYREYFDEEPLPNAFLVQSDGVPLKEIRADLADIPGFYVCEDFIARCSQEFQAFIVFVTAVSAIYIIVAIAMVFLVLKNILSQFVLEKKKELIVMKINGYEDKKARRYILFDTILLTMIGIVPGAVIGSVAGYYAVCSFDSPTISLLKDPVWISWLIGIAATFLLSLINCLSAMKQIDRFDISDITAS